MTKNDCLQTPEWICGALGRFDLDPCAGIETKVADVNWALEYGHDGLIQKWFGCVWCNPPFSEKELWSKKMIEHGNGILILPERGSAPWFGPLALAAGAYFVMGKKINFVGGPSSNNLGSVLFPFGEVATQKIFDSGLPGHFVSVLSYTPRSID